MSRFTEQFASEVARPRCQNPFKFPIVVSLVLVASLTRDAVAAPNCKTLMSRLASVQLKDIIEQKKDDVCKKLNSGGLDVTINLTLTHFELCEDGDTASAKAHVSLTCATSDKALIHASVGIDIDLQAKVNFKSCGVEKVEITSTNDATKAALEIIEASSMAKDFLNEQIKPYCD